MRIHTMLAAAVLLASPASSQAALLYVQPPAFSSARTSDFSSVTQTGFRMFDDFTLSTSASIEKVTWRGLWLGNQVVPAPAPPPDVLSWDIAFYEDNGGLPGAVRSSQSIAPAQVAMTVAGSGVFNVSGGSYNVVVYDLSVVLPTAVNMTAGTRYWFSPLARSQEFYPLFTWLGSDSPSGFNDLSIQQLLGANMSVVSSDPIERDRTFSLEGTESVPEPGVMLLVGTAAVAAAARRRRSRSN